MVAPALIGALLGGAYGGLTYGQDKRQADAERRAQAQFEAGSPWTHMHGHTVSSPSMLGNIEGGALTGATFGAKNFMGKDGEKDSTAASPESQTDGSGSAPDQSFVPHSKPANFVTPEAQNPAGAQENPYYNYADPRSVGYSPWNDMGLMPMKPQRPTYVPPGG